MLQGRSVANLHSWMTIRATNVLSLGMRRRWWPGVRNGLAAIGALWTLTEIVTAALPTMKSALENHGSNYIITIALIFLLVFLMYIREPVEVTFKIPNTDTSIKLMFGDLFDQDANLLIGVNEFFDGELGIPVSKNTVHGQFIVRNFGGSSAAFRSAIDPALAATGVKPQPTTRPIEPSLSYPIGTTARIPNGSRIVFLMAMAHTDLATAKAQSDVPTLWKALRQDRKSVV